MINKFKNTKSYLDNFSQEIVKLLKIEIGRSRRRKSNNPKGRSTSTPIDASGNLRESIKLQSTEDTNKISYDIESLDYGENVDQGRRASATPPPINDIFQWIKNKPVRLRDLKGRVQSFTGKKGGDKRRSLAFAISKSIGLYGIRPTNFISEALEASMGKLNTLGDSVGKDVMENIDDILLKIGYIKKGDNYEIRKE